MNFVLDYLVTAHLLPTNRVARVVEEPRAGFVSVVVSSFRVRFFSPFFGFLVWWFEQSQELFDECSDLCNGRTRGQPQQSYGPRMYIHISTTFPSARSAEKNEVIVKAREGRKPVLLRKKIS